MPTTSYRIGGLIALKTLSDVLSRLSSFLLLLLAARLLTPFEFGLFSLAWATGWILSIASDLGLQLFAAREVARRPGQAGAFLSAVLPVRLGLSLSLFGVIAVVQRALWWEKGGAVFLGLVLVQLLTSFVEFFNHVFRGMGRSDLESWANLAHRAAALMLGGWVLAMGGGLPLLTAALLVTSGCIVLLTWTWARKLTRSNQAAEEHRGSSPGVWPLSREFLVDVLPIGLGMLVSGVYFRLDLLFLEWFRDTGTVGRYMAVFRLVDAARLFPAAVIAVLFPILCRSRSRFPAALLCGGLGLAAVVAAALLRLDPGKLVLWLYGDAYVAAAQSLSVLAFALPFLFVNLVLTHQLIAWRRPLAYLWATGIVLLLTVPLNAVLIPAQGAVGAARAVVVRELALSLICGGLLFSAPAPRVTGEA